MNSDIMKVGLRLPQTDKHHATKENIVHFAKAAENAGFDSLWVLERLIWPINPLNPYSGSSDGKFPKEATENSIEQPSTDDKYPATKQTEEVAGQRDTKSADAADSADSMIV
jgi:hypothetical protein